MTSFDEIWYDRLIQNLLINLNLKMCDGVRNLKLGTRVENKVREEQCGIRGSRSVIDFIVAGIIEIRQEIGKDMFDFLLVSEMLMIM